MGFSMDINKDDLRKAANMAKSINKKGDVVGQLADMIRSGKSGISKQKAKDMIKAVRPMVSREQGLTLDKLLKEIE